MHFFDPNPRPRGLDITGIENALLDLLVRTEDHVIEEMGLAKGTMHLVEKSEQARILDYIGNLTPETQAGGSCANALRTVARLGAKVSYSSAVARDAAGDAFIAGLLENGVTDRCARLDSGATGTSVILVSPDGERTMNTHLGVCRSYSPEHVPHQDIRDSRMFFTTAYIWDTPNQIEAIEAALASAREAGCRIALDLADPFAVERSRDTLRGHLESGLDLIFANAEEARILTGLQAEEAVEQIARSVRVAVVKDGPKGAYIASGDSRVHIPAHQVAVVDTTGAGDCFAAGFLYGLIRELPLEICGKIANELAADTITHMGVKLSADIESRVEKIERTRSLPKPLGCFSRICVSGCHYRRY